MMQDAAIYHILYRTAQRFGVRLKDIVSPDQRAWITDARYAAYLLARELTGATLIDIGRVLDREHSSVNQGFKKAKTMVRNRKDYATKISRLRRDLEKEFRAAEKAFLATLGEARLGDSNQQQSSGHRHFPAGETAGLGA